MAAIWLVTGVWFLALNLDPGQWVMQVGQISVAAFGMVFADLIVVGFGGATIFQKGLFWALTIAIVPSIWVWGVWKFDLPFHYQLAKLGPQGVWLMFLARDAAFLAVLKAGVLAAWAAFIAPRLKPTSDVG